MKRLLFACGLMALTCPAFADNFDWTGPYVGVQGGIDNSTLKINDAFFLAPQGTTSLDSAMSGGADMGYNFDSGKLVYGAEIDANFITGNKVDVAAKDTYRAQPGWYGTARARVGFSSNNVLFYGTGGLAFGDVGLQDLSTGLKIGPAMQFGWVVGTGLEVAVSPQLSFKAEVLHIDLGKQNYLNNLAVASVAGYQDDVARIGINFHF